MGTPTPSRMVVRDEALLTVLRGDIDPTLSVRACAGERLERESDSS